MTDCGRERLRYQIRQVLIRAVGALAIVYLAAGCVPIPIETNAPRPDIPAVSPTGAIPPNGESYRYDLLKSNGQAPDLLVVLAFSGGGKRSAAFSYGVLEGMRDTVLPIDGPKDTLLDNVDMISSVSGGSFTAAYYGLYRDKIFETYERDFLKRDIEAYIYGTLLLPWNWEWMFASTYGTNDRMAEVYDDLMFKGATYADLINRGRPLIALGATEISYGTPFAFTQSYFDMICSDLSKYSIARAVAASNGFPIIFTPITLTSYMARCPEMRQALQRRARRNDTTRAAYLADMQARYIDPERTKYLHLMDGGIADNLALRGLLNTLVAAPKGDEAIAGAKRLGIDRTRRILIVLADGQAINDGRRARERFVTSVGQIFDAVSGAQIDQYNLETLLLAKREFEDFAAEVKKVRCLIAPKIDNHPCDDVKIFLVRLSLSDVGDAETRSRLQRIPTGLTVDAADVDALVGAGRSAVLSSPVIRGFVDSLK